MKKKIECIIMDWAGTAVDYGCFAPVQAFIDSFAAEGLTLTTDQVRGPMGLAKLDHIRQLLKMPDIARDFAQKKGREWNEDDVKTLYAAFEESLFATLKDYATPIEGVAYTIDMLRARGLKIGSTTGYTQAMMDIVRSQAAQKGYTVDNCVTPDGLPGGRPQPYMVYRNMIDLGIGSPDSVIKYGDTIADIKEGLNAKVWTVGVVLGSNEMGLRKQEVDQMRPYLLTEKKNEVRAEMYAAGADYVVDSIKELPMVIEKINERLNSAKAEAAQKAKHYV